MEDAFQDLVGRLDPPMYVVTTAAGGRRAGCLVGFLTQCSIRPPRLLVCLSKRNFTYRVARDATALAVHFLAAEDGALARLFGEETGDEVDKFARCDWEPGPEGLPVLASGRGWAACRVLDRMDAGDHEALLVEPFAARARTPDSPALGFQAVSDLDPGHDA